MARKFALRKLIELRISRGLSQRGLAELIDTSGVTVSRWERGATEPTPYNVSQLAKVFGVLPQVFYDDTISIISFNSSVPVYALSNGKKEEKGLIGVPDGMNIDFAIVADDSLEPEIREYSYLLFRKTKEPEHNKIFVIEVGDNYYLRKCVKIGSEYKFIPNKSQYESFNYDAVVIVGKLSKELIDRE